MVDVTIYVSSQAELYEALTYATGGETILLAPGNYGSISLGGWSGNQIDFASEVTIRSVDSVSPASFSGLLLEGVSNLTFDSVKFDYQFLDGDPLWVSPFVISGSAGVSILNSVFDGDLAFGTGLIDDGFGFGRGLVVRGSDNITVSGNEFFDWHRAALVLESEFIELVGNDIHDIRSDGLNFAQVTNVVIRDNFLHDFVTLPESGDHADFIQFWTTNTSQPSANIEISNNILDVGNGGSVQGIFIGNELISTGLSGYEMFYKDLAIENNIIRVDHVHGISVGPTVGLTIQYNTVVALEGSQMLPSINVSSQSGNVSLLYNVVPILKGYSGQADWNLLNNAIIQYNRPDEVGFYRDLFVESSFFSDLGVAGLVVANNSIIDQFGAGSTRLFTQNTADSARALFDVSADQENRGSIIFDGRYSIGADGESLPSDTIYIWTLPTGEIYEGPVLRYSFTSAGFYSVQLQVVEPNGQSSIAHAIVEVSGEDVLGFDQLTGSFLAFGYGENVALQGVQLETELSDGGKHSIVMGGQEEPTRVSRFDIERLFGSETFAISFSIQAEDQESFGEIFRLHSFFVAEVLQNGDLRFSLTTETGVVTRVVTTGGSFLDGTTHEVQVYANSFDASLSIYVNGLLAGTNALAGKLPEMGAWDLTFGNEWGAKNFVGKIHGFELDAQNNDYPFISYALPEEAMATLQNSDVRVADTTSDAVPNSTLSSGETDTEDNLLFSEDGPIGKWTGDVHLGLEQGREVAVFDGSDDSILLNSLGAADSSDGLYLRLGFSLSSSNRSPQTLIEQAGRVLVTVSGDSIGLSFTEQAGKGKRVEVKATDLVIGDGDFHDLLVSADAASGRIQLVLDNSLIFDKSGLSFDLDLQGHWWNRGWVVGEGSRASSDFNGFVEYLALSDSTQFFEL